MQVDGPKAEKVLVAQAAGAAVVVAQLLPASQSLQLDYPVDD